MSMSWFKALTTFHHRRRWLRLVLAGLLACGLAACAPPTGTRAYGGAPRAFTIAEIDPWGANWSFNFFSPSFLSEFEDPVLLPLAFQEPNGLSSYLPQLASSWQLTGQTFTIRLRAGARWSDGVPVTSTDIVDTALLDGIMAEPLASAISGLSAPTSTEVVFTLKPGTSPLAEEQDILNTYPLPASLYGKFLTGGVRQAELVELAKGEGTLSAPQRQELLAATTDLTKFSPSQAQFLSNGPYNVKAINASELVLQRSPTFFDASQVRVDQIDWQEFETSSPAYGEMLAGEGDLSWAVASWPYYQRFLEAPDAHIQVADDWSTFALYYNDRHYPLNLQAVRQAIAYIVHRPSVMDLAAGGHSYDTFIQRPSLVYTPVVGDYLTPGQQSQLNSYPYDPQKAAALLESVGFHKSGGQWIMPNGKPFTLTIDGVAQYSDVSGNVQVMAQWLSEFGIPTTAITGDETSYDTYQEEGDFDLEWGLGGTGVDPLVRMADVLGESFNLKSSADPGIGYGPAAAVPGLGTVNVPSTILQQANTVDGGQQLDALIWDWARLVNQELPILPYAEKNIALEYSSRTYGDWPQPSSSLWGLMGFSLYSGFTEMLEQGYIRPVG
jgi:peptide/nickel transport system substrate-binding protein